MVDVAPALPSIFWGTNNNVNPQVRAQIALAMLKNAKQPYPKTIGEGLSAIGNSLGDIGMARRLEQADIDSQAKAAAGPDSDTTSETPAETKTTDPGEAPVAPAATAGPTTSMGPSVQDATAANTLVNPQRNALAMGLMRQQAAGGPQANPTDAGDQPPPVSQSPTPNTPPSTPTVLSDVSKAPDIPLRPGMQLAQAAPSQAQPPAAPIAPAIPPAYVTPEPQRPVPQGVLPTPLEQKYINWKLSNPGNIYVEQRANAIIQQEQAKRAILQKQYESDMASYETMRKLREEQRASAVQRGLTEAESRKKLQEGPQLQEDVQSKFYWDPAAGAYRIPQVIGQDPNAMPQPKLTEYQGNSVKFANQMYDASHDIDSATLTNRKDAIASSVPLIHSWAEGQAYKGAQGAAVRWIMGKLRSESGATINPDEFAREYKSFIPVAGDGPEVIAQKAQARATAQESMVGASGPGRALVDFHAQQDAKAQQRMADEMGEMAKKTGKPIVPGKVYINPDQPGKSRIFINGRWREY